jgi:hypothetical protein
MPRGQSSGHRELAHLLAVHNIARAKQQKSQFLPRYDRRTNEMKIYLVLFIAFAFFNSASGQNEPKILLNEGEIGDTTVTMINGRSFGFRIEWGQDDNDSCKYEFLHGRETAAYSRSSGNLLGTSPEFSMHDIRRVMPGDRLVFNLRQNEKKFSRSYHVLSTKASETRPWYFDVYFICNGDTLNTDSYEISFHYLQDTVRKYGLLLHHYSKRDESEKQEKFLKYHFLTEDELPQSILIKFKKHELEYDFIASEFFHGEIFLAYTEKREMPRKEKWGYNATIEFKNKDADGCGLSKSFHMHVRD